MIQELHVEGYRSIRSLRLALVVVLLLWPTAARADRWRPPARMKASSPERSFEARITPRKDEPSLLTLWKSHAAGPRKLYEVPVVNSRSPVRLAVSETGHVLTADDWGRMGYDHALVLYDPVGKVIRDHKLTDLLSSEEIERHVDRTVSSRHWRYSLERPSSDNTSFQVTTSFGPAIHVAFADGSLRRDGGSFVRLQQYLSRARPCQRPQVKVIHVEPRGNNDYRAATCQLDPSGGTCHDGAPGFSRLTNRRKLGLEGAAFWTLLGSLYPLFAAGVGGEWRASFVRLELTFACSPGEPDEYPFSVDICRLKRPEELQALAGVLKATNMTNRVRCVQTP